MTKVGIWDITQLDIVGPQRHAYELWTRHVAKDLIRFT